MDRGKRGAFGSETISKSGETLAGSEGNTMTRDSIFRNSLTAFLGGLSVVLAQMLFTYIQGIGLYRINIDQTNGASMLSSDDMFSLYKTTGPNKPITFKNIVIYNTGSKDITRHSVSAVALNVRGYKLVQYPLGNPHNASVSYDGKVLTVNMKYFPAASKISAWIAIEGNDAVSTDLKNDASGVEITSGGSAEEKIKTQRWIFTGASAATSLVIAMLAFGLVTLRRSRDRVWAANNELAINNAELGQALAERFRAAEDGK